MRAPRAGALHIPALVGADRPLTPHLVVGIKARNKSEPRQQSSHLGSVGSDDISFGMREVRMRGQSEAPRGAFDTDAALFLGHDDPLKYVRDALRRERVRRILTRASVAVLAFGHPQRKRVLDHDENSW
jgi:hypothetical protein